MSMENQVSSKDWMLPINGNESPTVLTHKLATNLRSVGNFVKILTGRSIPVVFNTKQDNSYTDGKKVVISAKIDNHEDLDVQCGLALHEGSHCLLTDFGLLPDYDKNTKTFSGGFTRSIPTTFKKKCETLGIDSIGFVKNLLNFVEDRRIDQHVYTEVPGYRPYYKKLYNRYFNGPSIDVALLSDEKRTETLDSYMFRLVNIMNPKSDLDALNALRDIYRVLDLKNISRLTSSQDALRVGYEIGTLILDSIDPQKQEEENEENEKKKQEAEQNGEGGDGEPQEISDGEFEELLEQMENSQGSGGTPIKLTPEQREKLEKKIQQQKDFMDGKIHKEKLSDEEAERLKAVTESGTELKSVGAPSNANPTSERSSEARRVDGGEGFGTFKGVDCVVVHKMTKSLMTSSHFPMASTSYSNTLYEHCEAAVIEGIKKGRALGRKLQVRSEERETVFNHQKAGKIDKRRLSGLGFGVEDVFFHKEIDLFNDCNLHISVDASGSMGGDKWTKTMITVVALCKAADMISNLNIQVTFRTTDDSSPYIVKAYDSREDKFSKVKSLFKYLRPGGTTPEGLCFEAIMSNFLHGSSKLDSFFVNISDGCPYYSERGSSFYYSGKAAARHTRRMVNMIEAIGIKTLSYFMSGEDTWDGASESDRQLFRTMYGNGASFINTQSVSQVTRTLNKLFLNK